ncbi:dehydrogenase [Multifurca ochricompacta]|uniref:Dehydrogenase n=1 Tax=Multifurca ochricompacta TaxID=376703 RepID=A0AAD4QSG6_9AGAM|nr:dehydrogenase [Multifurca ochricompacta]
MKIKTRLICRTGISEGKSQGIPWALIVKDGKAVLAEVDVPTPGPGEVLVKVVTAAQNPSDWKALQRRNKTGAILGAVGPDVSPDVRYVGERVCGFIHGGLEANGSYSEYLIAKAQYGTIAIPKGWSFDDAAQIGLAALTAIMLLYETHSFPTPLEPAPPSADPLPVFVYGGSTAVGLFVVQFLKQAGLRVITTAAPHNFELLKSLGVEEVYNHYENDIGKRIREATGGKLRHAVDTYSEGSSPQIVSDALSEEGGLVAQVLPYDSPRSEVTVRVILVYDLLGQDFEWPWPFKVTEEAKKNSVIYGKLLSDILGQGKIKPMPIVILPNGLASVPEGIEFGLAGKISGQKFVYRIADTPK